MPTTMNAIARLGALALALLVPGFAEATLTVTPLTWNVIGLDSNNPATGPKHFPVGARVCSNVATTNVGVTWSWDSANPNVNLRPGSLATLNFPAIGAGACVDAYFEVEVTPVPAAYDTTRRYHVTATDGSGSAATPQPRELYVEHLISQSRNAVTGIKVDGVTVPPGGNVGLVLGNTYQVELIGGTATQGYNQFETFINFSNAIFQILSVQTTYSADDSPYVANPSDKLYADACGWENNPASPNYRSCVGGDFKAGGSDVHTLYTIRVIGGAGTAQTLSSLLYDYSGSSYHYNADYGVSGFIANVIDPNSLTFGKAFAPAPTVAGGTSTLTFTIGNPNTGAVSGVSFTDSLPLLSGGQMVVATPATYSTSGCGTPTFAPAAGATSVSFSGGTVAANGTCTVSVRVSVPALPTSGTYVNTSNNLFVGTVNTGKNATANLGLTTTPGGTNSCGLTLAQWTMASPAFTPPAGPAYSLKAGDVTSATAASGSGTSTSALDTGFGNPANSWASRPYNQAAADATRYVEFVVTTTNYSAITFSFDAARGSSGPTSLQLSYSTDGTNFTNYGGVLSVGTAFANFAPALPGPANTGGNTWFRLSAYNAANAGTNANLFVDNVTIGGCQTPQHPTLVKGFSPDPIAVGGTSTLTFTLANPNATPLTGVKFSDALPAGMQVAGTPNATTSCGGTPSWSPGAGATTLDFGQTTGATIPASSSCTASVAVTLTTAGPHVNVSGFISSTESGTNTGASGSASATLTGIVPPILDKDFSPNPVVAGGTSILTFTITNPNLGDALAGVAFADTYPAGLQNANPLVPAVTNTCGGTVSAVAGANSVSLSSGGIAAGASCTIEVPVTAAAAGSYANTSGAVSANIVGNGNVASDTLNVTAPAPAISLSKKVSTSPTGPWVSFVAVAPGTSLWYRFAVENVGNVTLNPFGVADPLLAGLGFDPATCAWQTTNLPTTLPALPAAGPGVDPTATCVLGPITAATGSVTNTATASGTYASTAYLSTPEQATYLGAATSFSLIKEIATSAGGPWSGSVTVAAGTSVYYRFTIANTGALALTGIGITDPLVSTASCTYIDPLPPAAATTCTVGPVTATGAPGSTTTNTATASGNNGLTTLTTPPASASYSIPPATADLAVTKTNGATGVSAGGSTTYTITVTNNGPDAVTGATLADPAVAGLSKTSVLCSATPGQCSAPPTVAQLEAGFALPALANGATYQITVAASVTATSGSVANTATVTAPAGTTDPTPGNNSATDTDPVNPVADLAVVKSNGATSVTSGTGTTYTITVTNNGPSSVTGATLSDPAVAGLSKTAVACSGTPGQCVTPPTVAQLEAGFALPALANGATYQITVTATVTATGGSVANTATVAPPVGTTDPTPGNDSSTDTDPVGTTADLAVVKTNGVASVTSGTSTTYTITVTNNGPSSVTGATLSDPAVAGLSKNAVVCSATPGQCATPPSVAQLEAGFALPALANGQSYQIAVTATVTAGSGSVANTATVAPPAGTTDPTPGNDSSTDTDTVDVVADLAIVKTNGASSVSAGGSTTYTVTVTNNGPSPVTGATLSDPAVAGLSKTAVACSATPGQCVTPPTVAQLEAGFALPALASGQTYQITVTASVTATSGSVANTATVAAPAGTTDPTPGNNTSTDTDPVDPVADLAVQKSNGVSTVTSGTATTYTITVTNSGPSAVAGAILADPAAAGLSKTAVACSATPGQCATPPSVAQLEAGFALPALASGATYQITVVATVTATGGSVANTAAVAPPAGTTDPTPGNNSSTDTDAVQVVADLAIVKSNGVASVTSGTSTTYTVTVTNNGPSAVTGASIADPAVAGLSKTAVACSATPGQCATPPTVAQLEAGFALPALSSGATYQITVTASVTATSGSVANTATVSPPAGATDPTPGNNSSTDSDTVSVVADLAITKDDGVASVVSGNSTTYTINVTNNGPSAVTGAILADPAATGLAKTAVACSATPGQCSSPPSIAQLEAGFALPALASGATYQITVTATVTAASGSVANTATIAVPAGASDPTPGNNSASDTDTVTAAPVVADLAVTKSDGATNVTSGTSTTYTVTVTNNGPSAVTGATLSDPAVAGLSKTAVACSATPGQCSVAPTVAQLEAGFALPALANGATYQITVTALVTATGGTVANTATVAVPAGATDPTPGNDSSTDTDTVDLVADLAIAKSDGVTDVASGASTTYTITVTNNGPSAVTGAILADPAATGLAKTAVVCSATPGQCVTPPTVAQLEAGFALPALASGATYQVNVTATVTAASGTVVNTATIAVPAGTTDPTPGNNTASDTDTVTAAPTTADLAIVKTNGSGTLVPGAGTTYTITVTNNGPAEVTNAAITDTAPAGLAFGAWTCAVFNPGSGGTVTTACGAPNGFGNIATTATMKVGAVIVYTLQATVAPTATGIITNVATVAPPPGITDPTPANDSFTNPLPVSNGPVQQIPTLADWSLVMLSVLLAVAAAGSMRGRARVRKP